MFIIVLSSQYSFTFTHIFAFHLFFYFHISLLDHFLSKKLFSMNMLTTDFLFLMSRNILIFERYFTGLQILSCQFFAFRILEILWLSLGFQSYLLYCSIEGNIPPPPNFSWLLLSKVFLLWKFLTTTKFYWTLWWISFLYHSALIIINLCLIFLNL